MSETNGTVGYVIVMVGAVMCSAGIAISFTGIGACLSIPMAVIGLPLFIVGDVIRSKARAARVDAVVQQAVSESVARAMPQQSSAPPALELVWKFLCCAFLGGAFVLASCSSNHTLTPRTAKAMIVKANDTTPLHYSATYGEIERIVAEPTIEDYTQGQYAPGSSKEKVKELIAAGYVAITRTEAKSVPTVAGEYSGTFGPSNETWLLTANLSNVPNTDTVTGSFSQVLQRGIHCRADGSVSGVLENNGEAKLHFEASKGEGGMCTDWGWNGPLSITRSDHAAANGTCTGFWNIYNSTKVDLKCNMRLPASAPSIESKRYYYGFTPKFQSLVANPGQKTLIAGDFKLDEVTDLLLVPGMDSAATATEVGHVDYNPAAKILTGQASMQVSRNAEFRKQPDGDWVLTGH
jgi:hypothetical protein